MSEEPIRILVPRSTAQRLAAAMSRRRLLALGSAAAAGVLAACGGDDKGSSDTTKATSASTTTAAPGTTTAASTTAGATTTAAASTTAPSGNVKRNVQLFTWAQYDDENLLAEWGTVSPTIFDSNEQAVSKLVSAGGKSGYDLVCPTGSYIPQMVSEDLLEPLDLSRIPNFSNLDVAYTNQPWDPGNKHSVCKDWGSTGWIYDTTVVKTEIKTWSDFIAATQGDASGQTSVLDTPADILGIYFWANGIDWNTTDPAQLDAAEKFMTEQFAKHIRAFDSYPGINLTQGNYALSQAWNGDARQGLLSIEAAGGDPTQYKWAIGAPNSELWMDNWCIVKNAPNKDGAYDFINFILDKQNSIRELEFHGYNTGLAGIDALLPADLKYKEIIFFPPEVVATWQAQLLNEAQDRKVEIYNKIKAAAGG
jgi:spermidine/putrescine transport system substrate-binding protein